MSNATATVMSCMRTQKLNANGGCAILWPQLGEMAAVRMPGLLDGRLDIFVGKKNWKLGKVKHQESWSPNCSFCKWFLFGLVLRAEFHERLDNLTTHHLQFRHFWQGLSASHFTRRHFKLPSKSIPCSVAGGRCSTFISENSAATNSHQVDDLAMQRWELVVANPGVDGNVKGRPFTFPQRTF